MRPFDLLIKPVSFDCNMACQYCFYRRVEDLYGGGRHLMSDEVLEAMVGQLLSMGFPQSSFCWQGGEPLLAGLPFFRKVVAAQMRLGRRGQVVANAIQTNGTLIDSGWASFFRRYRFFVGVSLDGPKDIHDRYRLSVDGRSTFERTMAGIAELRRRQVAFNILCVVSQANVHRAGEVFRFFLGEGLWHLQFIPCVEGDGSGRPLPMSITGAEYGEFLCEIFDQWLECPEPRPCVRLFDAVVEAYLYGRPRFCILANRCDAYLLVEHNGDVYPCDFFAREEWRLGNLLERPLAELQGSALRRKFSAQKSAARRACGDCRWWDICHGGCLKDRLAYGGDFTSRSPLCEGLKRFFEHAAGELQRIAERIRRRSRERPPAGGGVADRPPLSRP